MTFFEVYDRWLEEHRHEIKETSFDGYIYRRKVFSHYISDDTDICTLDEGKMRAFFERFRKEGKSRRYMSDMLTTFRMVMHYAEKTGTVKIPSLEWKLKDVITLNVKNTARQRTKRYTDEDYERIVKIFETDPTPVGLAVIVTMFTGIRLGEACGLKFSDIDLDEGVIHIQRTCVPISKSTQRMSHPDEECLKGQRLQAPKSAASDRFIPIIPSLRRILRKYAKIYPGDYFVSTLKDTPGCTRAFREQFRRMVKKAGVTYIGYHSLSHSKIFY